MMSVELSLFPAAFGVMTGPLSPLMSLSQIFVLGPGKNLNEPGGFSTSFSCWNNFGGGGIITGGISSRDLSRLSLFLIRLAAVSSLSSWPLVTEGEGLTLLLVFMTSGSFLMGCFGFGCGCG